jgi:hypothetical protein
MDLDSQGLVVTERRVGIVFGCSKIGFIKRLRFWEWLLGDWVKDLKA